MNRIFIFDEYIKNLAAEAEKEALPMFNIADKICQHNTEKVLSAFMEHRVSEAHLAGSSGYGYGDRGRDTLEAVFAQVFGAEDALVRHSFASGTAAIATALFGVLRPGDTVVSISGTPYDTIKATFGIGGEHCGSLKEFGVKYRELPLLPNGRINLDALPEILKGAKAAYIQRSRGYSLRPSITVEEIREAVSIIKGISRDIIVITDNCYGEFAEECEPTAAGSDLIMGSLIKNPGGGIARTGGYIAGRKDLVEMCSYRMTAPGIGREVGCSLGENKNMYMGLFFAPSVVKSSLKTAIFAASVFNKLGYEVTPAVNEKRTDIIQSVILKTPAALSAFCRGVQKGAPIDSFVIPEAWDMPGYDDKVIMAAGAFNMGASIELSADGPMREPYAAWLQGGLTWESGKLGIMFAAEEVLKPGK